MMKHKLAENSYGTLKLHFDDEINFESSSNVWSRNHCLTREMLKLQNLQSIFLQIKINAWKQIGRNLSTKNSIKFWNHVNSFCDCFHSTSQGGLFADNRVLMFPSRLMALVRGFFASGACCTHRDGRNQKLGL